MTPALTADQRATLQRVVATARELLEADLEATASGTFGIDRDGAIADERALRLDPGALADRRDLTDILTHLHEEGEAPADAVARLLREAVFTHLNRLVAIRIAETIGLLPPSLADGRRSQGFRDLQELAPLLATDATGGYWTYLQLCGDELASDVPTLFDPRNPLLALVPSPGALDELVASLAAPQHAELWAAPDCLGWVYQFFNDRTVRATAAPKDSSELAVRNQFFTPRYVVDYLVHNTLGRRLAEIDGNAPDFDLLIDPARGTRNEPLDTVTVLDPACGSGHFLLGCYDVLEAEWEKRGVLAGDAAPRIVDALWGIDIDPRCAQVAAAALMFRARLHCRDAPLPAPNIVTARALPRGTAIDPLLDALPARQRELVNQMIGGLDAAPDLGSLLKVEELLASYLRRSVFGSPRIDGTLAAALPDEAFAADEKAILHALTEIGDAVSATPGERLLAAEAGDAVRFIEAVQRRYDVLLMNPPFGEPIPETKRYLKAAYPWIPWKDYNLLAAFVGRGLELLKPGGYVGAITSRTGFFLATFEQWRREVLLSHRFLSMLDLGSDVMEGAMVEAAAYVIANEPSSPDDSALFIRLLKATDRAEATRRTVAALRAGETLANVVRIPMRELERSPAAVFAYWDPSGLRTHLINLPALEGPSVQARVGLQTSDDVRFIRASWEVRPERCTTRRDQTHAGRPWVPLAKGGDYSPYYSDFELVVNWGDDGRDIREFDKSKVQNQQHYFMAGVTWPERTVSAFAPQVCPPGVIFSVVGPLCRVDDSKERLTLLAWLNSRPIRWVIEATAPAGEETKKGGTAARHYTVGGTQRLPWIGPLLAPEDAALINRVTEEVIAARAELDVTDETTRRFVVPGALRCHGPNLASRIASDVEARERLVLDILDRHDEIDRAFLKTLGVTPGPDLDEAVGPSVASLPQRHLSTDERDAFSKLYQSPVSEAIDAATARLGMARFVRLSYHIVDRRLELLAMAFECHPRALAAVRRELGLVPPDELPAGAAAIFSYLVGAAFGRWDVRIARSPDRAPAQPGFSDPPPICAPGMLLDADGMPLRSIPADYPLDLPQTGLLVDEPGHPQDIERAVRAAASACFDDEESALGELLTLAGRSDLRQLLRRHFFKDHLGRYTKSHRKAPIYWPLYVPSGAWGAWLYAPVLSRETLFALAQASARRLDAAEAEIRRLQREREGGGAGRTQRDVANALDGEERLAEELRRFRANAERIANLGWEPNLDDGLLLCAAPLADLFPTWKDAELARKELKTGEHPWATVSKWADEL